MRYALVFALALTVPAFAGCLDVTDIPGSVKARLEGGTAKFAQDCAVNTRPADWPDPCTMRASWNEAPGKAEIDLAVNPTDPLNVIVASKDLDRTASECVWSIAQVTKDGGKTWKTVYIGGDLENRIPELQPFRCVTDPIMAFDENGVAYYALQAYRFVGPQDPPAEVREQTGTPPIVGSTFWLTRSFDGGETWENFIPMHIGDGPIVFHDYPRMMVNPDSGSVHTIWNGVGNGGITPWVVTSRDGGETVEDPVTFYAPGAERGTAFESGFAAQKDGTIYVTAAVFPNEEVFVTGDSSDDLGVHWFRSTDDAASFEYLGEIFRYHPTPRQLPNNEFRTPSFVELAIDTTDGAFANRAYVFYPDYATGDSDILTRHSDDGGASWSDPQPIHTNVSNDQFMMRPRVGGDGTVHVLYYDRVYDDENFLMDAVHAWSSDGGVTWQNARLTNMSFNGDLGVHQNGFPFIGDYNGIDVASDGTVYLAWGDTLTGVAEIAFARLTADV